MTTTPTRLPVLFLTDQVVLPGMVVPVELDDAARAAIDAAQASGDDQLLIAAPGRALRALRRRRHHRASRPVRRRRARPSSRPPAGRIGAGTTGPGAALWVEVDPVPDAAVTHVREARRALQVPRRGRAAATRGVADHRRLQPMNDPDAIADSAGCASYLSIDQSSSCSRAPTSRNDWSS